MKFPKWYIKTVIRIALALFDHINLKVVGFEPEEGIKAVIEEANNGRT